MSDDATAASDPVRASVARPTLRRVRNGSGASGTVVFVHGTMDTCVSFRRVAEQLPDRTLFSYDRRGWGASRRPGSRPPSLTDHVDDLAAVVARTDEPILVGHSYGGLIALCAAARTPERVRAVVAFEPPVRWLPWWPPEAPWERLVRESADDPAAAAGALLNEVVGAPVARMRPAAELAADGVALLAEMRDPELNTPMFEPLTLDVPAVVAAGERSLAHHIEVSARLAELLPRGRYLQIPDAGHAAHVRHPAEFAALVDAVAPASP
ncbi:alpha/beta fold hydrolase [Nocardia miyunensis]|uniref:alpha/beta fold hydrolase n=1 Tax=Nocardia miyunensis TaxID=282684 RepID=UPI0008334F36|nr:alpha/beta hydrolase [Nocardia miyunensis]